MLARTHEQLARPRRALADAGVPVRRDRARAGSPLAAARAGRSAHCRRRRSCGRGPTTCSTGRPTRVEPAPPSPSPRPSAASPRPCSSSSATSPSATASALRAWIAATNPFTDAGDGDGVELLTFHAAKGREWHTVVVTGVETGLVPHRSATTVDGRAEEARLLHVAFTRAADRLVITHADGARGYARQAQPVRRRPARRCPAERAAPAVAARTGAPPGRGAPVATRPLASLTAWRDAGGAGGSLLPDQICSDDDLSAIAATPPVDADELSAFTGFGPISAARHFGGDPRRPRRRRRLTAAARGRVSIARGRRPPGRGRWATVPLRALRSITTHSTRSATGGVASTRSMRRPRPWWKSPRR